MATSQTTGKDTENCKDVDFLDPSFILQNIVYDKCFEMQPNFSVSARNNMIECMCDQICFYVMCAFRAHHLKALSSTLSWSDRLKSKPPAILVYGSGILAECVLKALADMGCAPYIKVFSRDVASAKEWVQKGFRSTVEMKRGYELDILLICSNLCSFSQMCRDLTQFLTAKTFIISNVFCLQRKRMYNLFGTPGIVRTYVERKGASKQPTRDRNMSARAFSARQLASKKEGVKNLILILENYMIALDIHKDTARREAMHLVVGTERVSLQEDIMRSPYRKAMSFSNEDIAEDFDDVFSSDSDSDSELTGEDTEVVSLEVAKAPRELGLFFRRQRSFEEEEASEQERKVQRALDKKHRRKLHRLKKQLQSQEQPQLPTSPLTIDTASITPTTPPPTKGGLTGGERGDIGVQSSPLTPKFMRSRSKSITQLPTSPSAANCSPKPEEETTNSPHQLRRTHSSHDRTQKVRHEEDTQEEEEARQHKEKMDHVLGFGGADASSGAIHSVVEAKLNEEKSPILTIIRSIEKRYGEIFRRELAKHILVMDLPSLEHVKQKSPRRRRKANLVTAALAQRASLARKRTELLSVIPTVEKKHVGYLSAEELLAIFQADKKTSNLTNDRSVLLEEMDAESEEDEEEGMGDELFLEDKPREKFRFFVLDDE